MRIATVLLLLPLPGCGLTVAGEWLGVCSFTNSGYQAEMEVYADIWTDNGYALEGTMTTADWNGVSRTGELLGERTGRYVTLRGRFLSELGYYELELDGERSGRQLEGTCSFRVPEGSGALIGDGTLSR